ncbi:MAG: BON domain-containing protein [Acidobacteria bacterium]|jgi:osmotically-inducible protein OsmY|nr:BON domain-containing protein [Acidobacteriota bacterium]
MKTIRAAPVLLVLFLALPAAFPQGAGKSDSEMRAKIAQRLAGDPVLQDDRLTVEVADGVATVSGTVDTLYESWKVRDDVVAVFGVVGYQPLLSLENAGIPDSVLTTAVGDALSRRLLDSPEVGSIVASVDAGVVTLSGTLRDSRKRFDARDAVARVSGVKRVVDQLLSPEAPDDEIQKAVAAILAGGTGKPVGGQITTQVDGGIVTLTGTVPLLSSSYQAEELAWGVNGVRGVESRLTVDPPSHGVKVTRP